MPVQPRFLVKFLLKFKYENVDRLAFQKKFYSKTRMDGHITIRKKSVSVRWSSLVSLKSGGFRAEWNNLKLLRCQRQGKKFALFLCKKRWPYLQSFNERHVIDIVWTSSGCLVRLWIKSFFFPIRKFSRKISQNLQS